MIKYRYNLNLDPEPVSVDRVQVVSDREPDNEFPYLIPKYFGDVWWRVNCHQKVGGFVRGRIRHPRIGRSHRSVSKKQWRRERDWPRTLCRAGRESHHGHWFNGDRYRSWGNFRGYIGMVIDIDAFSRMRTMYRRRRK